MCYRYYTMCSCACPSPNCLGNNKLRNKRATVSKMSSQTSYNSVASAAHLKLIFPPAEPGTMGKKSPGSPISRSHRYISGEKQKQTRITIEMNFLKLSCTMGDDAICEVIPPGLPHCGRLLHPRRPGTYAQLHDIVSLNRDTKDGMRKVICIE